tara:strand:+ start:3213 stop:4085 length:873 start_codon:yes stop_codon:yes gene_type:complete
MTQLFSGGSVTPNTSPKVRIKYPKNWVQSTSAGHMIEMNNTKGGERVRFLHGQTRNFIDMDWKKDTYLKSYNDTYVLTDHNLVIKVGKQLKEDKLCLHVIGDVRLYVEGDMHTEVDGNRYDIVHKNWEMKCGGVYTLRAEENMGITSKNQMKLESNSYENKTTFLKNDLSEGGSVEEIVKGNYECKITDPSKVHSVRSEGNIRTEANGCSYEKVDGNKFTEVGAKYKTTVAGGSVECTEGGNSALGMNTSLDSNEYKISTTGTMQINTTVQTQINGGGAVDINAGAIFLN